MKARMRREAIFPKTFILEPSFKVILSNPSGVEWAMRLTKLETIRCSNVMKMSSFWLSSWLVCVCLIQIECFARSWSSVSSLHPGPHLTQTANSSSELCSANDIIPASTNLIQSQLPFTKQVQELLLRHQHPLDCEKAAFLVYSAGSGLGIGAKLDFLAGALGRALDLGRVLLIDYDDQWVEGAFCRNYPTMDTCFFEPISSCSLAHIYGNKVEAADDIRHNITLLTTTRRSLNSSRIVFEQGHTFTNSVPLQLHQLVLSLGLKNAFIGGVKADCYWWRAQGVSYLFRPNRRTLREISALRADTFQTSIRPGTIAIHVRHGDKHRDGVPQVSDDVYYRYAEGLLSKSKKHLQPRYFLSTEDPETVLFFQQMYGKKLAYVEVHRDNHAGGSPASVADPSREMLFALLNLELALECDAWVCTLASMWCTLIDRLRATVKCKASNPYEDAHGTFAGLGHV